MTKFETIHSEPAASSISTPSPRLTFEEMASRDMERAIAHGKIWDDIFSQLFDPRPSKKVG